MESVGLVRAGTKDSMLATARLGVGIKGFDLEGREVTLSSVELTGFDAQIRRDRSGQIDLLVPSRSPREAPPPRAEAAPAPVPAAPPPPEPAPKPWKVRVERVKVDGAKVAVTDERVARGQIRGGARDRVGRSSTRRRRRRAHRAARAAT